MVPYRRSAELPLLPFEKRLIHELGCTEDEYRAFSEQVRKHPYIRPAEYAHVPDARAETATIIAVVSLVIGLASTAASFLLAPKPQQPRESDAKNKQLASRKGRDVFTPTSGFDSVQDLASYGTTVPIVFTRRETLIDDNDTKFYSGGVLISPAMAWSRIKSFGNYQIAEIVAIAGQGYMERPDLAGIFLGTNALDALYNAYFDFYWNAGVQNVPEGSRLQMRHLRYGSLSIDDGKGPAENAFYAPTKNGANEEAFSGAMTPSSQTRFGVFAGIPNGTPIRPDWEVHSIIKDYFDGDDFLEAGKTAYNNQKKYVDPYTAIDHPFGGGGTYEKRRRLNGGMPGTGRNYCRRVGITSCNGVSIEHTVRSISKNGKTANAFENLTSTVVVNVGDELVVTLGIGRQDPKFLEGDAEGVTYPTLDDVRSSVDGELRRFDSQLRLGATFMIGRTIWQVTARPTEAYDPKRRAHRESGYSITLRCIDAYGEDGVRRVGIVAPAAIRRDNYLPYADIEESFYPITQYEIGSIQNTRRCDVTEIGIKSQVWCRFNNITNFNTLKTAGQMARANKNNVVLREGKMTKYAERVSFFAVDVRPTNTDAVLDRTRNRGWINLGPYVFAVLGDSPVDLFSFIRITHPNRSQLEFQLRPIPSAVFAQQSGGGTAFALDGRTPYVDWISDNYIGTFRIGARGHFIEVKDYFTHSEMAAKPGLLEDFVYGEWIASGVTGVTRINVVSRTTNSYINAGDSASIYQISNILSNALGTDPYHANLSAGETAQLQNWVYDDGTRSVNMTLHLRVFEDRPWYTVKNKWWQVDFVEVTSSTGNWSDGESFNKASQSADGTLYYFVYEVQVGSGYVENDLSYGATRLFEKYSKIAEVSHYGDLVTRSCDSGPEHEVVYVNECLSEDPIPSYANCAVTGLKLRSSDNFTRLDQLRCYIKEGIHVERLTDGGTGASNLLTDLFWYLVTNTDTGAGSIMDSSLVDRDALVETGRYLKANQLFFDDAIAEPINLRSWLSQIAPSVLCYTSIKNGRLSLEPALPYDGNYEIDANTPIAISAMFTDGNIIDESLKIDWLELEDRKLFQAAVIYTWSGLNKVPEQQTLIVRYSTPDASSLPLEEFSLPHITTPQHALLAARYFLAVRKHVTHTITFQTLPWGLDLAPGSYIRVSSELSPYNPTNNGIVKADGTVISAVPLTDGTYAVHYWERSQTEVETGQLVITNGKAQNMRDSVFSVYNANQLSSVYMIEALDINEDGIVTIKASNFPVDADRRSLIARDTVDADSAFEFVGGQAL